MWDVVKGLVSVLVACLLPCAFSQAEGLEEKRPSVRDEKSGNSVGVKDDDCTLVARDKQGKVLCEVDVITKVGAGGRPAGDSSTPLKDGKVMADHGEHSFAVFNLTNGEHLSSRNN
jgi:hypothetical protein